MLQVVALNSFDLAELLCCWGAYTADIVAEFSNNGTGNVGGVKMTYKTQGVSERDLQLWQVSIIMNCVICYV